MSPNNTEHGELKALILENQQLLAENNLILKKMRRVAIWDFALRMVMMALFLGLPLLVYYYAIAPYYESLESAFHTLQGMSKIPSWETMVPTQHSGQ